MRGLVPARTGIPALPLTPFNEFIKLHLTYFAEHKKCMAEGQGLLAAVPKHDWVIIAANWSLMPIRTN